MAAGYWKLDVNQEVAHADVPSHLGNGAFTIMRVDTRAGQDDHSLRRRQRRGRQTALKGRCRETGRRHKALSGTIRVATTGRRR